MSHANATLTPVTRLRLARLVVDDGYTRAAAAKMFMVSPRTAAKWVQRYRAEGHKTSPASVEVALRDKPSLVYRTRTRAVQLSLF